MSFADERGTREEQRRLTQRGWRLAPPPQRPVLFVNPKSGNGAADRAHIVEHALERGIEPVVLTADQDLTTLVDRAIAGGADALGVAGGDGTLALVAATAAARALPFVCIPAGTRNHFAMDIGVDRHDLVGALDAFGDGVERWIDLADVNGRVFLNNVSLGLYGEAVRRDAYRNAKIRTLLATAESVLGPSASPPELRLRDDSGQEHQQPAVVLVSNNPYAMTAPGLGSRPSLATGRLGIIVLDAPGGKPPPGRAWTAPTLEVFAASSVHAGIDGEPVLLDAPLRFVTRPAALCVRLSPHHPGASPSSRVAPMPLRRTGRISPGEAH